MIRSSLLSLILACSFQATAEAPVAQKSIFLPEDFAQFAPLNARDMVERIPGFRLSDSRGQDESRGLGQATENVLINGQRISSKSSSAADILERIPAATVERIELREGASLDIPGLSGLVVNVIAEADEISGTWAYRARIIDGQTPLYFGGELSLSGQQKNLGWTANVNIEPRGSAGSGTEIFVDPDRNVLETRDLVQKNLFPDIEGSLGLRWTPASGLVANMNVDYINEKRDQRESADRLPSDQPAFRQLIQDIDESTLAELSGDVEFDALAGRLKLIGVYSDRSSPFTSKRERTDPFGDPIDRSFFRQVTDESELILRSEYKWEAFAGSWEASFEVAENTLDSSSTLLESFAGAELLAVDIGESDVSVEESRSEGFLTYSRLLGEAIQLQLSLGAEVSEITSSGANGQIRTFTRPKGGATLSWQFAPSSTLNARLNRRVGQLDFFDFVSQLDLNDGDNQVGNSDIVPEQSWRIEVELEQQFGAWGAGNVLVFAEALEDIVDQIPVGDGEGPGNIDDGTRYGIEFEGTINFDPVGIEGAQLVYSAGFRDSEIEDPLTGETRAINREDLIEVDLELRHDIAGTELAWGFEFTPELSADNVRLDSIRTDRDQPGRLNIFVEHKDLWGLTARAEVFRPFNDIEKQSRLRFDPDRTGSLVEIERSRIVETPILIFELNGRF
ncbi:MAG: TonB-dependent receptor plug domain-containing protein [Henriciella sp.]